MKNYNKQTYPLMQTDGGMSFAILMVGYILISFLVQAILLLFTQSTSALYLALCACLSPLSILLVILYQAKYKRHTFSILSVNKFDAKHLIATLLLSVGMFLGLGFVNIAFAQFVENLGLNVSSPQIPLDTPLQFVIFVITLAVLPAIFEEMFFRGLLLTSLNGEKMIGKILTVSLCFALYHCSISQFIFQFIYGVAFCLLAIISKSIIPCIISHFLNNFFVLLFNYLKIDIDLTNIALIVIGMVALIGYGLICYLNIRKMPKQNIPKKGQKAFYLPFGLFAICMCLFVLLSALLG